MTVSSQQDSVQYPGDNASTVFPIPFYFLENTHIVATLTDALGVVTTLVQNVNYTLLGAGNPAGGSLTSSVAVSSAYVLRIFRNVPATQLTDYQPNDDFPAETHERALDKLTMLVQQSFSGVSAVDAKIGRTVRVPVNELIPELPNAAGRANTILGFDSLGNPYVSIPASGSATDLALMLANSVLVSQGAAMIGRGAQIVKSIAELRALLVGSPSKHVFATGYYAQGDGGGGQYWLDSTDTTSADNGGSIIVAVDGGRWKLTQRDHWSVLQFGAKGDGATNDTVAIQSAIDALPARGGEVTFPGGTFAVTSTIRLGNGNAGTTFSTKNGIKIKGQGAGFAVSGGLVPTILTWAGASGAAIMSLNGRISDCEVSDIFFSCNGVSGGLFAQAFSGCRFTDLKIVNPATGNNGITLLGGLAPTGNYNIFNKFSNISIGLLSPTSTGLFIDGNYAAVNDTWLTSFELVRIETFAGATSARCAWFKFIDSCTFNRCHFDSKPEPASLCLLLDASGNPGFLNDYPIGLAFYDCSITKIDVIEDATSKIGPTYFYGHGVNDIEVIPNHPRLFGITANGDIFGPMAGFKNRVSADITVQNNTGITPVYTYTVGAYFLGGVDSFKTKNGGLRVRQTGVYVNNSGAPSNFNVTVTFGGVTVFTAAFAAVPTGATARTVDIDFTLLLSNNVVTAEHGRATVVMGAVGSTTGGCAPPYQTMIGSNNATVDTSTAKDLVISVQHSVANGSIAYTAKNTVLELL